jgi:hypothetical protein
MKNDIEIETIYIVSSFGGAIVLGIIYICVNKICSRRKTRVYTESDAHMIDVCLVDVKKLEDGKEIEINV